MLQADTLIEARWVIPVAPRGVVLENAAVVVSQGRIEAILPIEEARARIVITHRRGTMEEADVLYGVTMQEQGISRMLTINLNDVAEELDVR